MTQTALARYVRRLVLVVGVACGLSGCDEGVLYHSSRHVPAAEWGYRDTLSFTVDTVKDDGLCHFEVGLRVTEDYPYKSIWLGVERSFSPPAVFRRDTVECFLSDSTRHKAGGLHLHQYVVPLPSLQLWQGQSGQVRIVHLMNREALPGIYDVGVRMFRQSSVRSVSGGERRADVRNDSLP